MNWAYQLGLPPAASCVFTCKFIYHTVQVKNVPVVASQYCADNIADQSIYFMHDKAVFIDLTSVTLALAAAS
jgi:hypothetical protein